MPTVPASKHALRIADNIAILHLLHEVPEQPSSNPIECPPCHRDKDYSLPFNIERRLAIILSYLSCLKDDPNHIPALVIKEDTNTQSLHVLIAVNKTGPQDGNTKLQSIQQAFKKIFEPLPRVSDGHDCMHEIFSAIVSTCSERIRERLRYQRPMRPKKDKKPLKAVLAQTTQHLAHVRPYLEQARELMHELDAYSNHQTDDQLRQVVESTYRLSRLDNLEVLLRGLSDREMQLNERVGLLNIIKKVARYQIAARVLYRTAKRFPIARKMETVLVELPDLAFERITAPPGTQSLLSALKMVPVSKKLLNQLPEICQLLDHTERSASEQFASQRLKCLTESKIHAETQLIFYCEITNPKPFPRVISSSKDACFLCSVLINRYGKFHVPRQHGRLYPGWRMPSSPLLQRVETQLSIFLENAVRESAKTLLQRQKRTFYIQPSESTAISIAISDTTIRSLHDGVQITQVLLDDPIQSGAIAQNSEIDEAWLVGGSHEDAKGTSKTEGSDDPNRAPTQSNRMSTIPEEEPLRLPLKASSEPIHPVVRPSKLIRLKSGIEAKTEAAANSSSRVCEAWPLLLEIEFSSSQALRGTEGSRYLTCQLERLSPGDGEAIKQDHEAYVIPAEEIQGTRSMETKHLGCFYIAARDTVLKIKIW